MWLIDDSIYDEYFERALSILVRAVEGYPELLGTLGAYDMIHRGCFDYFDQMCPYIEDMLERSNIDIRVAGAILACIAALKYPEVGDLAKRAITGDVPQRSGAAKVFSQLAAKLNIGRYAKLDYGN